MGTIPIALTLDEFRAVGRWAADCADRVLLHFEAEHSQDQRPREAIEGIRQFAHGGPRVARLRSLSMGALAAAREVSDLAARASARSACMAASSAYTHPLASVEQARHILGPAVYAALAREHAEGVAAGEKEIQQAIAHATPAICEVLRRFPAQPEGRTRLAILYRQLDSGLRAQA